MSKNVIILKITNWYNHPLVRFIVFSFLFLSLTPSMLKFISYSSSNLTRSNSRAGEWLCSSPTDLNNSLFSPSSSTADQVTTELQYTQASDTRLSANKWCWQCESKSTLVKAALVFATIQCVKTMAHRRDRILALMSRSHQVCRAMPYLVPTPGASGCLASKTTGFFDDNYCDDDR